MPDQHQNRVVASLLTGRVAELGPGTPNPAVHNLLSRISIETDFAPLKNREMAQACLAGLWLYHDYLDESHAISQDLHTPEGSFWHAILHRREPDAGNSKYWWHRVGAHPVLDQLREQAPSLGYAFTTPFEYVDFCERVRGTASPEEELARRVQQLEWQLLFDWCFRHSTA